MDKTNRYYIVVEGTNNRARTEGNEPLIVLPTHIDKVMDSLVAGFEEITIEEYERTFTEVEEW